jgi:hypothetical protein
MKKKRMKKERNQDMNSREMLWRTFTQIMTIKIAKLFDARAPTTVQ